MDVVEGMVGSRVLRLTPGLMINRTAYLQRRNHGLALSAAYIVGNLAQISSLPACPTLSLLKSMAKANSSPAPTFQQLAARPSYDLVLLLCGD